MLRVRTCDTRVSDRKLEAAVFLGDDRKVCANVRDAGSGPKGATSYGTVTAW